MFGKLKLTINLKIIGTLILGATLYGCGDDSQQQTQKQSRIVEVELKQLSIPLYFNGTIEPLEIYNVISPIEGVVNKQYFQYGQNVKKGDALYSISADKLEKEYIDAIASYMKSLDDYTEKSRKYTGTQELWKLKFISDNDYHADKIAKEESFFSLKQSIRNLKETLKKMGMQQDLSMFETRDPKKIADIVAKKLDNYVVKASDNGIALDPKSASIKDKESEKPKVLGSDVKQGEILLNIGDLTGLSVSVKVNEIDVNQIKIGQKATISGPAFQQFKLEGEVGFIDSQAKAEGSALPTFPVKIVVAKLTPEQREIIRVGMSAKVAIQVGDKEVILVPIDAVDQEKGMDLVRRKDRDSGEITRVPVIVGKTTVDSIVIEKGLNPGDQIVVDN